MCYDNNNTNKTDLLVVCMLMSGAVGKLLSLTYKCSKCVWGQFLEDD